MDKKFDTPSEIIEDIRLGKMVILIDDEDRENEGDVILASDHVSTEAINFMVREARGLVCLALSPEQIERLRLPQMVRDDLNDAPNKTAFTVSIEASSGVTTGISAADRAHTVRVASNPAAKPSDVHAPGHIFPIRAQKGGVLRRAGHTEASVDLCTLAGLNPAAVICEVMNEDGSMARVPDLLAFAKKHQIKIGTIVDLIEYRLRREVLIEEVYSTELPSRPGFCLRVFRSKLDGQEHLVLQKGEISNEAPTLVRVQLDSYTRDFFNLLSTGASALTGSLNVIEKAGSGILLILRGNNRPTGLVNDIQSLLGEKSSGGMDDRDYGIGAQILRLLGVHQIKLITNRLERKVGLKAFDLEIVDTVPMHEISKPTAGL